MTRINLVHPTTLIRQHLVAEYRELPRVFTLAERHWLSGKPMPRVSTYRLGPGHLLFFYDKLAFLRKRHFELREEMRRRGYKANIDCSWSGIHLPDRYQGEWYPGPTEIVTSRLRINQREAEISGSNEPGGK